MAARHSPLPLSDLCLDRGPFFAQDGLIWTVAFMVDSTHRYPAPVVTVHAGMPLLWVD